MALRLAGESYPAAAVFDTVTITDGAGHYLQLPKLTTSQRDGLSAVNGMVIYNTTTNQFERYQAGVWEAFGGGDMYKATYDADLNGVVDNSERLGGSTKAEVQDHAPRIHASSHGAGGSDEISVQGLSGELADCQKAKRLRTGLDAEKPASGNTEGDVWWATDTDKFYVWDGTAWQEVGASGGLTAAYPRTQVLSGTSGPNNWADIDLSSVVGANRAWVLMEFRCDHNVISEIRVRPNGYTTMQDHGGCSAGEVAAYQEIYFWTFTDENGIIEWMTEPYGNPWNGYVCGYIREA